MGKKTTNVVEPLCNPCFNHCNLCHLGWGAFTLAALLRPRVPAAISKQAARGNLSISPVRERGWIWGKEKARKWITLQNGESHLLPLTKKGEKKSGLRARDKEIPFVRTGNSALFQHNQLTEQVGPWVNREIMLPWCRWVKNMIHRVLSLFEYGYLWNIQFGATDRPPRDSGLRSGTWWVRVQQQFTRGEI